MNTPPQVLLQHARARLRPAWWALALTLGLALAWDFAGWDLALARWAGNSQGFALTHHWFLQGWLHDGARIGVWVLWLALTVWVLAFPGLWRAYSMCHRLALVFTLLLSPLLVSLIKSASQTSCPWSLQEFGGTAQYLSHWAWGQRDGGGGGCFPAGHASGPLAYLAVVVWLWPIRPKAARLMAGAVLLVGLTLGLAQQWRGAHFMSHTLWTLVICWAVPLAMYMLFKVKPRNWASGG